MYETVIYAHMKTFRFTGTPALYIECDVRMCHGKCPVMPCDWREGGGHGVRRRRSAGNITTLEEDAREERSLGGVEVGEQGLPGNFSESLNLFQSIQVLANEEEERAFRNETESSKYLVSATVDADCDHFDLTTMFQEYLWTRRTSASRPCCSRVRWRRCAHCCFCRDSLSPCSVPG